MKQVILFFSLLSLLFSLFFPNDIYGITLQDVASTIVPYQEIIVGLISLVVGSALGTFLVQRWNVKKEIHEKRSKVLDSYFEEFKTPVRLMDSFIARLLIGLSDLDETGEISKGKKLKMYLTWNYSIQDLEFYKEEIPKIRILDNPQAKQAGVYNEYSSENIPKFFAKLSKEIDKWIINTDIVITPEMKFEIEKEFNKFEEDFHNLINKGYLSTYLAQYYIDKDIRLEYYAMWEFMLGSFFLIRKMRIYLANKNKLLDLAKLHVENLKLLHNMMINFETKLINGKIQAKFWV